MKERPVVFDAQAVRAILDGRKTQMRSVVKRNDLAVLKFIWGTEDEPNGSMDVAGQTMTDSGVLCVWNTDYPCEGSELLSCPLGAPGDQLLVKEPFVYRHKHDRFYYRADHPIHDPYAHNGWEPPARMPMHASRIRLEISDVRVERLQGITAGDCESEGVEQCKGLSLGNLAWALWNIEAFRESWKPAKGAGSWKANPWVWVVSFRRVQP